MWNRDYIGLATLALALFQSYCHGAESIDLEAIRQRLLPLENSKLRDEGAVVDTILIHFCSDVVERPDEPYDVERLSEGFAKAGVSAHYLIDREGRVIQWVALERAAYHAGKGKVPWDPARTNRLNEYSIGIELMGMGTAEEMVLYVHREDYAKLAPALIGYTDAQYASLRALIEALRRRYPKIGWDDRHVYGHDDFAPGRKTDPGSLFDWGKIGIQRASW